MKKNMIIIVVLLAVLAAIFWAKNNAQQKNPEPEVVLYTSLDQIIAEPIIKEFEQRTGIRVKVAYDTEAAKTAGSVDRLLAEKNDPNCDVFWNNEIPRTIMLKDKGILEPYFSPSAKDIPAEFKDASGYWTGFAARARVLIVNVKKLGPADVPLSIFALTQERWKGACALANPLFGTTATHCAALFVVLGPGKAKTYFQALKNNAVAIVPSNAVSRDRVAAGELSIGFTDTGDAWMAMGAGQPVKMVYPDQDGMGTLLIPNTVCLIKNSPHPNEARQLIDFLLSETVEEKLAFSPSMQIPLRKSVPTPSHVPAYDSLRVMKVDYEAVARMLPESGEYLTELFLK